MKSLLFFLCITTLSVQSYAQDNITNSLGMRFVKIPAGEFMMGTEDIVAASMEIPEPKENELLDETPAHKVMITQAFYLAQTEVTQQQWFKVMENKPGPESLWRRADWKTLPVASVNWHMAARFVAEINKMDTQYRYRLPTEAEWEYVAKDGKNALRPVATEQLEDYAWFIHNSNDMPQPVATRKPNNFGVYDMIGNVWEWVDDWYAADTYSRPDQTNPGGPASGHSKVRRGGSFHCPLHMARPGYRSANTPDTRYEVIGFRLVAEVK